MEQFANFQTDTLASAIVDGTDATATVSNGSALPATGTFRVRVDDEIMLVTARASNVISITRGTEGTVAAGHASGSVVKPILTAAAFAQLKLDILGFVRTPPVTIASADANYFNVVDPFGGLDRCSDVEGGILVQAVSGSSNHHWVGREEDVGSGTYTVDAEIVTGFTGGTNNEVALWVRDFAGGQMLVFSVQYIGAASVCKFLVQHWTNFTTYGGGGGDTPLVEALPPIGQTVFLRVQNDGTFLIFSYLVEGVPVEIFRVAKTTFVPSGGNRVGFGVDGYDAPVVGKLKSWKKT